MPAPINDVDPQPAHCLAVASLLRLDPLSPPARDIDDPQRRVPTLIRDVGDVLAVVGPARGSGVEVTVGDRKGIAAFARHQPQLMPLAAEVGAVDDAPAVGGPVGTGLPRGFFVADLPRHRARPRRHPPESARSVDVAPVRDEEKLTAVRRPRRREIVVPPAVVIAGEPAVLVFGQAGDRAARWVGDEDVPAPVVQGRHERETPAFGRPARLDVHRAVRRQGSHRAGRQVEQLELDRIVGVAGEGDRPAVARPVGLIVVAGPGRELLGDGGADALAPERALHRVDQRRPIRCPGHRAGPARHLGDVHLPPVIGVRHVDLLQDRLALGGCGGKWGRSAQDGDRYRGALSHRSICSRSIGKGIAPSSSSRS